MQIISVVIHFPDSPRPIFTVPFHALRVKCIYLFTARNALTTLPPDIINSSLVIITTKGVVGPRGNSQTYFSPIR